MLVKVDGGSELATQMPKVRRTLHAPSILSDLPLRSADGVLHIVLLQAPLQVREAMKSSNSRISPTAANMSSDFYVGKRLSYGGDLCTVRYVGEVTGTRGEWLGVEWDDPSRGKHSGEAGGNKYFECSSTVLPSSQGGLFKSQTVQVSEKDQRQVPL
jgi:hypothetical protein